MLDFVILASKRKMDQHGCFLIVETLGRKHL